MSSIIRAEGLSKKYVIGHERSGSYNTLRDELAQRARALARSALHPFTGRRPEDGGADYEEFWALRDVSFEVQEGERLGIIGRNGAGKSTLLKILSRVTEPTGGRVTIGGRVASLLEVGTGFHPELSGRENIFLNGAVLGMSRGEIARKFDEIVAFAEVEKFLDTPVKRYSSGMYVRLAFAVAAHLEPDILVVDEVLGVGDAEFQKRCLGKMKEDSGSGRTVLFVSHNTTAIQTLCPRSVILERGKIDFIGKTDIVIDRYLANTQQGLGLVQSDMNCLRLVNVDATYRPEERDACVIAVRLEFETSTAIPDLHIDFGLENQNGIRLLQIMPKVRGDPSTSVLGFSRFEYDIESTITRLAPGEYFCTVYAQSKTLGILLHQSNIRLFRVSSSEGRMEWAASSFTSVLLPGYTAEIRIDE